MSRRSNKSHRVPNVKLRPAQNSERPSRPLTPPPFFSQSKNDAPDCSFYDPCPRPFKGVVICATGVDKSSIFSKASQLGANTTADFTDRVTHLIANDHGGAKYYCALERKIPIMQPSWVIDSFEIWQKGDDIDFKESIADYRLPIFSDVTLCLSGIDDIPRRTQINSLLRTQQGTYVKNIERPVRVTHLLCGGEGDDETDKMRYARKFNDTGEAKIFLVWEEWFWDSLEFGGRFPEADYKVDLPRPERKQPPTPHSNGQPSSSASVAVPDSNPTSTHPDPPPSSLPPDKHSNDDDEEEIAKAKRVPAVTLQVWESLLGSRGFKRVDGQLVRDANAPEPARNQEQHLTTSQRPSLSTRQANPPKTDKGKGKQPIVQGEDATRKGHSALSTFTRTNSFAPFRGIESAPPSIRQPFRKTASAAFSSRNSASPAPQNGESSKAATGSGLFTGLRFRARGEARCKNVRDAVEGAGGVWIEGGEDGDDDEDGEDVVLVRLVSGSKLCWLDPSRERRAKYRTECWLEGCLARERICAPDEHVSFVPLGQTQEAIPLVVGASEVVMSPSGLDMAEDIWVKRLARALGINHMPTFSRASTHLLCPSGKGAKFEKAREWNIPVVGIEWLEEMGRVGHVPDTGPYLVAGSSFEVGQRKDKAKEKQRATDGDMGMMDITNATDPPDNQPLPRSASPQRLTRTKTMPAEDPPDSWGRPVLLQPIPRVTQSRGTPPPPSRSPTKSLSVTSSAFGSFMLDANAQAGPPSTQTGDDGMPHIPSSTSPSPLKMPTQSSQDAASGSAPEPSPRNRTSPLKPAVTSEAARALQESITSLLGKRNSVEGRDVSGGTSRKRPRPRPTSKPQSRQDSGDTDDFLPPPPVQEAPVFHEEQTAYSYGDENGMLDALAEGGDPDESRLVTYEDPVQAQEKRRLLNLLGGEVGKGKAGEGPSAAGGIVRRKSTRLAGF